MRTTTTNTSASPFNNLLFDKTALRDAFSRAQEHVDGFTSKLSIGMGGIQAVSLTALEQMQSAVTDAVEAAEAVAMPLLQQDRQSPDTAKATTQQEESSATKSRSSGTETGTSNANNASGTSDPPNPAAFMASCTNSDFHFKEGSHRPVPTRLCKKVSVGSTEEGATELWLDDPGSAMTRSGLLMSYKEQLSPTGVHRHPSQALQALSLKLLRGRGLMMTVDDTDEEKNSKAAATSATPPNLQIDYLEHDTQQWRVLSHFKVAKADPIWGGPLYSFGWQAHPKDMLVLSLLDNQDEELATVQVSVQQLLHMTARRINQWITLKAENDHLQNPEVQLRLTPTHAATMHPQETCPHLQAGPALPSFLTSYKIRKDIMYGSRAPVLLNVYDVSNSENVAKLNDYLKPLGAGGIFHGAIEIFGREYSFGGTRDKTFRGTGVFACAPKQCPIHHYKESVYLGDCDLTQAQIANIIAQLEPQWLAKDYNLFRKNCCFFSQELAIELGVGDLPEWVYCLASKTQGIEPQLIQLNQFIIDFQKRRKQAQQPQPTPSSTDVPIKRSRGSFRNSFRKNKEAAKQQQQQVPPAVEPQEATEVMLDHAMAARIQRNFRSTRKLRQSRDRLPAVAM